MLIGYARVSTDDQKLDLQLKALNAAGCEDIFTDKMSGSKSSRPGLDECLSKLRKGDKLIVWRLDRLGRSIRHLIDVIEDLHGRGIGFECTQESIDTTTPGGELVFHVFAALAQFERAMIRERTLAGLAASDKKGGRPKIQPDDNRIKTAKALHAGGMPVPEICGTLKIGRTTFYRWMKMVV